MKLALHHSITFWSGLLVMGFVCWAWKDSFYRSAWFGCGECSVASVDGGLMISRQPSRSGWSAGYDAYDPHPDWDAWQESFFQRQVEEEIATEDYRFYVRDDIDAADKARTARDYHVIQLRYWERGSWLLFIPHWLILIKVAAAWLGLLFWRARRRAATTGGPEG